jgi:ribosomal protein S12
VERSFPRAEEKKKTLTIGTAALLSVSGAEAAAGVRFHWIPGYRANLSVMQREQDRRREDEE